jgi:hypothetical protein
VSLRGAKPRDRRAARACPCRARRWLPALAPLTAVAAWTAAGSGAGVPDPGLSTASAQAGSIFVSPAGGGRTLAAAGCVVMVIVRDGNGQPIANFPFQDIWLDSANPSDLSLCPGGSVADGNTDATGRTTISGTLRGGGFTQGGLAVLLAGTPISGSPSLPVLVNSPDITGDLMVNLGDVGPFSSNLNGTYGFRSDFFHDGIINLADVGVFSEHLGATCP